MTVQALKEAVIHLGFSETLDDNDALFRESAARALAELSSIVPRIASFTLYHLPPVPRYQKAGPIGVRGTHTVKTPGGKSFFASLSGKGSVTARSGSEEKSFSVDTAGGSAKALFGTFSGEEGEIVFSFHTESSLTLLSLAVYQESFTQPPDPHGHSCYDLAALIDDFGALHSPPVSQTGRTVTAEETAGGYRLESGHLLYLSNRERQILSLSYRRRLALPEEGELPLTEEEAQLLPLLCAAYVWLEDDPDKATFYFNRFREGAGRLFRGFSTAAPYNDRTSWG